MGSAGNGREIKIVLLLFILLLFTTQKSPKKTQDFALLSLFVAIFIYQAVYWSLN